MRIRSLLLAVSACVGLAGVGNAEVVANLGTITVGQAEGTFCNTAFCAATAGLDGGSLPVAGPFEHQIVFKVSATSGTLASAQALNRAFYDIGNVSYTLWEQTGGSVLIGGTATGVLLATAGFLDQG